MPKKERPSSPPMIPLFPLPNVVLFPGMPLGLHIFEDRYRQMTETVLAEGGPFGILLCKTYNPDTLMGEPFEVGTTACIETADRLPDGRFNLSVVGDRRFHVTHCDTTQPYLQGEVVWLCDTEAQKAPISLQADVKDVFKELLRLAAKVLKQDFPDPDFPDCPEALSYYVARHLRGSLVLKQSLLEMTSTVERLEQEKTWMWEAVRALATRSQIEAAFD